MTAQPTAPPRSDVEILEALDFQPQLACEWVLTGNTDECGAPAVYLVVSRQACCPPVPIPMCAGCWDAIGRNDADPRTCWHCSKCRRHVGFTRDETFVIVCHLKGGRS